ncbi:50S ribosomal protein L23 [Candidatus Parcubacteria bacterium]|nr:50S ribosomal protein L23 [Candidatus Parcubacteria bacterium]
MADKTTEKKSVLIKPRITEKSAIQQELRNVYAFNVERDATKKTIVASIRAKYKVTPVGVRMVSIPSKKKFFRGKWGVKGGGKKAYVYLKKGDKIDVA